MDPAEHSEENQRKRPPDGNSDRSAEKSSRAGEFKNRKGQTVHVLPPSDEYVRSRSIGYRKPCLAALLASALGCLIHWVSTPGGGLALYVITATFVALGVAFALRVWNMAVRSPLALTADRQLTLKIAILKLVVHTRLGEKLGIARTAGGRLWKIYYIDRGRPRYRFKLSAAAFPDLADFLEDTAPGMWQEVPQG